MKYFISLLFSVAILNGFSANPLWQNISSKQVQVVGERKIIPQKGAVLKLDDATFRSLQQSIPAEQYGRHIIVSLPLPDGSVADFRVFERTCMEQGLADRYPMIKTYQAISVENPFVTAKLDYTPFGFHAMVFSNEGVYFIDPYTNLNTGYYNCYYKKDYVRTNMEYSVCGTKTATDIDENNPTSANRQIGTNPGATDVVLDSKIRTFRLALACTIEYAAAVGGPSPTKATVLAAMITSLNRVNGVYEKELSIHMNLVPKNDTLIFITSDSYTNNNGFTMLGQNTTVLNARIGSANYDIGHVFSTGGGGVAGLGVVCSVDKAEGVTGLPNPVGDSYDIDYVAHEMGHQYGGNHTFNGNTGSCSGNRNSSTAYEVGSGTTIMAYAGICTGNNPQQNSDAYFHRVSLQEIFNYISTTSCAVESTHSATPTVTEFTNTYNIPYKTSFEISAFATSGNSNPISYCWEEYDLGPAGNWNATNNTAAPIFRSFNPTESNTRVFPRWDSLINNNIKYLGEILPETTRNVKFRCTVRGIDNNGYGVFNAPENQLMIKSVTTTTLFRVNSQAAATTITGNTNQTITWDVAGTTAAPISCANVNIYLSLDSARTFPYLLAFNTPNDGTESVLIPNVATNNASARIKVKGSGNVFFDLNDGWIRINQAVAANFTVNNTAVCEGSSVTFTNASFGSPDSVRWTINGGSPVTSNSSTTISSIFNTPGSYSVSLTVYKAGVASTPYSTNITVNPKKVTDIVRVICEGESVTVGTEVFTANGDYTTRLQTSAGCDSTVNLALTVNPKKVTDIVRVICEGESVTVGTEVFTANGDYTTHLQTSAGCDSTVNLALTVNPKKVTDISREICEGESVTVGTDVFTANGNYTTHLQTSKGCDSTVNLALTVNPKKVTDISRIICEGESVTVGTDVFTANGDYTTHLQTSAGCDSTVNLALTVNPKKVTDIVRVICEGESVTVGTEVFTANGNYTTHLQTSKGCDSTVNLALTVNPKKVTDISIIICEGQSVTVGTDIFTANGNYTTHLQTSAGCDSTVNLALTVNQVPSTPAITQSNDTLYSNVIIAGASYYWYKAAVLVATTTVPYYKFASQGTYTLKITNSDCESPLSASFNTVSTGIKNNKLDVIFSVVPNPNNGQFVLKITAAKNETYQILMYNVAGQEIRKEEMSLQRGVNVKQFQLDAIEKGMYFISLIGKDGVITQNIIVQ